MAGRRFGSKGKLSLQRERVEPGYVAGEATSTPGTDKASHIPDPSSEVAAPPQAMNPLWKTRFCSFYNSKTGCRHGRLCTFAHGNEELRTAPDFTRTSICPELLRTGKCTQVHMCPYAHNRAELRPAPGLMKTRMCDFHKTGTCMAKDLCRFAHQVDELSPAAQAFLASSGLSPEEAESMPVAGIQEAMKQRLRPELSDAMPSGSSSQGRRGSTGGTMPDRRAAPDIPFNEVRPPMEMTQQAQQSEDMASKVLQDLQARLAHMRSQSQSFNQMAQIANQGLGDALSTGPASSEPLDPWLQRRRKLSQDCAMIEESITMLHRWSSLDPHSRATLLQYLRHLPQSEQHLRGPGLAAVSLDENAATLRQAAVFMPPSVEAPEVPPFQPASLGPLGVAEGPYRVRTNFPSQAAPSASAAAANADALETELAHQLEVMTQFFAEKLQTRSGHNE